MRITDKARKQQNQATNTVLSMVIGLSAITVLFASCVGTSSEETAVNNVVEPEKSEVVNTPQPIATPSTSTYTPQPIATPSTPTYTPQPTTTSTSTYTPRPQVDNVGVGFVSGTCSKLKAMGLSDFRPGDPNYTKKRDRDNDGVACES